MTVKEATSVLRYADKIVLVWDEFQHDFNPQDSIMAEAFGNYKVSFINGFSPDGDTGTCRQYEIGVVTKPVKDGEA